MNDPNSYLDHNGNTTYDGQRRAGQDEARRYNSPSEQQPHESWDAYQTRKGAFEDERNR